MFLRSNPVSPDSRVEKEVNALIKAGHHITILAWDREVNYKIEKSFLHLPDGKCKIIRRGIKATFGGGIKKNLIGLVKFQLFLFEQLTHYRKHYDLIHACDFDTALTAYISKVIYGKKMVYDIFDYYSDASHVSGMTGKIIESLDRHIINHSDACMICSEKRKQQINHTRPKHLTIIHNAPPFYSGEAYPIKSEKIKLVYVGILCHDRFLTEFTEILAGNPLYELHIGGFGQLEDYFTQMSLKYDNVIYYGKLKYQDTLRLEKASDIMLAIYNPAIKNHRYAAPNKFYEALMLGKPLIMAKNTGMDDMIGKYDLGKVFDYSKEDFIQKLNELVTCRNSWKEMSIRMKRLYHNQFSWKVMEERLISLYTSIEEELT